MTRYVLASMFSTLLLAGCSSAPQPQAVNHLHNEVNKLNQTMRQLTTQATVLEQQNQLNANSAQGAWLLPSANTAVILQSNAGELRLSLSQVEAEANGTRAILNIRAAGEKTLPALSAEIEWGERDPVSGKPLQASALSQTISVPSSLVPQANAEVPLRLSGITPEQLGYVRVHDVTLDNSAAPATTVK
ncbi:DUF3251 domain-containing protein [Paramixta manurensis]|uniref:DUF3251 domain-containing protein n=1 Tax=Paramixta manurensis TaxID=2740817 RepID=A0A6M8U660_9GAMM|nr:DUF3251 domain-containing protein [Erwiniaceae bacterium PD-1]